MKFSLSLFFVLFILGFLPVSCLWSCKEFYIGKYDIEFKTTSTTSSGSYTYDSVRIAVGNEMDSVLNATYFFGCDVKTTPTKIATVSKFNVSNFSQCMAESFIACTDSLNAKFNIDSIHVYCDAIYNGIPAFDILDSNAVAFTFNISGIFNPKLNSSTTTLSYKNFDDLVSILNSYSIYSISKIKSKKPTEYFEPILRFGVEIKKPTDSQLTKFFIKFYLSNGTALIAESKKIYWL